MRANKKKNIDLFNLCSCLFQIKIFCYYFLFTSSTGRKIHLVDKSAPKQVFRTSSLLKLSEKTSYKILQRVWTSVSQRETKVHDLPIYINCWVPMRDLVCEPSPVLGKGAPLPWASVISACRSPAERKSRRHY